MYIKPEEISSLVKYRMDQARTALDDGLFLFEGKRSPQSIINRAYYSMFYAVLALLQTIGKIPAKHSGLISLFDTEFVIKGIFGKNLSKDLHRVFEMRQVADYQSVESLSFEEAQDFLNRAKGFVNSISEYLKKLRMLD